MLSNANSRRDRCKKGIMPDLRQLRAFVTLAETLHFGRAASRLHLSQPPLSRQIMALEKALGVRLVERHSRQVSLTHAGQRFLADARDVLDRLERACRDARRAGAGEIGELALGFMMHAAQTIVPSLARRFMDAFPAAALRLREVMPNALVDELSDGRLDLGIMFPPPPVPGLVFRQAYRERLCVVLDSAHPLAGGATVRRPDLAGQPLILAPAETAPALRGAIETYCREGGFAPTIRVETQLQMTIVSLAAEGIGIGIVPVSMRRLNPAGVCFRELEDAPAVDHVLAWRQDNDNPVLHRFLGMIEAEEAP
jgi:DNA-binding transcriptional LysR family regulator